MLREITFAAGTCVGRGRNGVFKCTGVEVMCINEGAEILTISAQTSRGASNSCWFELPIEKVDELIQALKEARDLEVRI